MLAYLIATIVSSLGILLYFVFEFSPEQRWTVFFLNKALAEAGMVVLGLSFLLGPISRLFAPLRKHLVLRRYFGLAGFILIVIHVGTSLMQYMGRFPLTWYQEHLWGFLAGVAGLAIFLILALTSSAGAIQKYGFPKWKTIQRFGYLALILALVHIAVAAQSRWQQWLAGTVDMPSSFVVFAFGVIVLVARFVTIFFPAPKKAKK
ncbi:hypothetical protein C4579_03600 [Candidatus Microgenomates bacterium]|nr:MAG: hypothetical protein C4579_03600 [Candidatus Microgenomates bacterium]